MAGEQGPTLPAIGLHDPYPRERPLVPEECIYLPYEPRPAHQQARDFLHELLGSDLRIIDELTQDQAEKLTAHFMDYYMAVEDKPQRRRRAILVKEGHVARDYVRGLHQSELAARSGFRERDIRQRVSEVADKIQRIFKRNPPPLHQELGYFLERYHAPDVILVPKEPELFVPELLAWSGTAQTEELWSGTAEDDTFIPYIPEPVPIDLDAVLETYEATFQPVGQAAPEEKPRNLLGFIGPTICQVILEIDPDTFAEKEPHHETGDWRHRAHCKNMNPAIFETSEHEALAKAICRVCPVRVECLSEAFVYRDTNEIVMGGMTGAERHALLFGRQQQKAPS